MGACKARLAADPGLLLGFRPLTRPASAALASLGVTPATPIHIMFEKPAARWPAGLSPLLEFIEPIEGTPRVLSQSTPRPL